MASTAPSTTESAATASSNAGYTVKVTKLQLPTLEEVAKALEAGVSKHFDSVEVEVVQTPPDFTTAGWELAAPGLCGDDAALVVDLGSVANLLAPACHGREYDLKQVAKLAGMPGASIIGAGAGVPAHAGIHAELIPNLHLATGTQKSKWVAVNKDGKPIQGDYKPLTVGIFQNLLLTGGVRGPAVHVKASGRKGDANFTDALKLGMEEAFDKDTALGGVFRFETAAAATTKPALMDVHVMDAFPTGKEASASEFIGKIPRFDVPAPLVCATTLTTRSTLRPVNNPHTHCFAPGAAATATPVTADTAAAASASDAAGCTCGGHYHNDVTKDGAGVAVYDGYFVPAAALHEVEVA